MLGDHDVAATLCISRLSRAERMELALAQLAAPPPGTKGMGPKDRADRLHAEMVRRGALAREALRHGQVEPVAGLLPDRGEVPPPG